MRPLHWTVLATHVPPGGSLGGVVRYTTELIRALSLRDDVVVTAVTTRAAAPTVQGLLSEGSRVRSIPGAPASLLSVAERWAPLPGLRSGADVVLGTKHLLPSRSSALRVLTIHDLLLLDRPEDFGTPKRQLLPRAYLGSIRDADLLLCVSDATRQRLQAHAADAARRAAVVHLATSSSLVAAQPAALPSLAGRRFALVVGDSSPRKNLQTVVAAMAAVRAAVPDAVLAMVGPPSWGRTEVGDTYDQLVADGAIVAVGYVNDAALRWAYEHAEVVLCPSLAEGFGLPAAEALAFGAPVIISQDAALREVCAGRELAALPALATQQWATQTVAALKAGRQPAGAIVRRSWDDVADDSMVAVRTALQRRSGERTAG